MSWVAQVSFDHVMGPRAFALPLADALGEASPAGTPMVAASRYGLAVGRLLSAVQGDDEVPAEAARPAVPADLARHAECREHAARALAECRHLVECHDLQMRIVSSFLALDEAQLTFFFVSPCRVDFRGLLRDAVQRFRLPLRLEQVGERDGAMFIGGIGRCGRALCCRTWLTDFAPVSLRHARAQDLPPLPAQLSGQCSKLRCCLRYELDGDGGTPRRREQRDRPLKTANYHWLGDWTDDDGRG